MAVNLTIVILEVHIIIISVILKVHISAKDALASNYVIEHIMFCIRFHLQILWDILTKGTIIFLNIHIIEHDDDLKISVTVEVSLQWCSSSNPLWHVKKRVNMIFSQMITLSSRMMIQKHQLQSLDLQASSFLSSWKCSIKTPILQYWFIKIYTHILIYELNQQ